MVFDPVLELALGLLHECLVPQGACDVLANEEYKIVLDKEALEGKTVRTLVTELSQLTDCFSKEYLSTLTIVRDIVLAKS